MEIFAEDEKETTVAEAVVTEATKRLYFFIVVVLRIKQLSYHLRKSPTTIYFFSSFLMSFTFSVYAFFDFVMRTLALIFFLGIFKICEDDMRTTEEKKKLGY